MDRPGANLETFAEPEQLHGKNRQPQHCLFDWKAVTTRGGVALVRAPSRWARQKRFIRKRRT